MLLGSVRRAVIACLMVLIPLSSPGYAQETTGTILGTLVDQTGAVLPGVRVVITSVETGQEQEVTTNNVGQYSARLAIGKYQISFFLPKFQPFTARGITLHVNDRYQVDAKLEASGVIEILNVSAERLVQPTSAVHGLIQPAAIQNLPLLTRTFVQVVALVPGVSSDLREDACFCDQGNLNVSINGARRSAVNWLFDGASNVNGWNNYTMVTTPSLEAIQEINVITSTYSAEWARNGGGVVNAVSKSGANRFSGSVYEFLRNDALNANSFFRNMDPRPQVNGSAPRLRYNNFGYTLGGPALPSRKKLFFFFSQEWRRSPRGKISVVETVPDPNWLSDSTSPNYVPPEARDANAVKLLTLWPTPNVPGTNQYRTTITSEFNTRQEFMRADYQIGANWYVTGRYLHDRVDSQGDGVIIPEAIPNHRFTLGQLAVAEARWSGGRLVFESSYQVSSNELSRIEPIRKRSDVGILVPEFFPENALNLIPNVSVDGLDSISGMQPWPRQYLNHALSTALTWQRGSHALKTGGLLALEHVNSNLFPEVTQGSFGFGDGGGFTAFQNFLTGNANGSCGPQCGYFETDIDVLNRFRPARYETYIQDTWRIDHRLTLDIGLRYAFYRPLIDDGDKLFTFFPGDYDPAQAPRFADETGDFLLVGTGNLFNGIRVAGKDSPYGRAIYAADKNNLQPRIGGAWDPTGAGRLLLRGGYGMYFDQTQVGMFAQNVQNSLYDPFRTDLYVSNPSLSNPAAGSIIDPSEVFTPDVLATSDRFVAPRWQQWNVGVQRQLYAHGMAEAGYIGSRGDHLPQYVDINQPQPADFVGHGGAVNTVRPFLGYGGIVMRQTTARSRYHGLTASFRHDAGVAGSATVNYTYSRNRTDATYDNDVLDDPQNPLDLRAEFAPAQTDRSHIFNAYYVYELPLAGKDPGAWRKAFLGAWQVSGITRIESGPAVRIRVGNCTYDDGWCFPGYLRPNQVADPAAGEQAGIVWFNPSAFVPSPAGEYGTAPVAPFRLPGRHQWDISIAKTVDLATAKHLRFRADFINAFNETQFQDVATECVGIAAMCNPRARFGQVTSTWPPRQIELGVRFDW